MSVSACLVLLAVMEAGTGLHWLPQVQGLPGCLLVQLCQQLRYACVCWCIILYRG